MSGFEHQVASHMIAEGLTDEALVITKAIHDRYHASKRNPFNEIECSDHYARAMASYGSFITACGYEYDGPRGFMRFAPKWNAGNFTAAFTAAEGWGSYSQKDIKGKRICRLSVHYGRLSLKLLQIVYPNDAVHKKVVARIGNKPLHVDFELSKGDLTFIFGNSMTVASGQELVIEV
jgi:hypothetical protein